MKGDTVRNFGRIQTVASLLARDKGFLPLVTCQQGREVYLVEDVPEEPASLRLVPPEFTSVHVGPPGDRTRDMAEYAFTGHCDDPWIERNCPSYA